MKTRLVALALGVVLALCSVARAADVDLSVFQSRDADVSVTWGSAQTNRRTATTTMTATLTNTSTSAIAGDFYFAIAAISPSTAASVTNAPDRGTDGTPLFKLGPLAAGASAQVSVQFKTPTFARFSVATHVWVRKPPLQLVPDEPSRSAQRISVFEGGTVTAHGADGVTYTLVFPPYAVAEDTDVSIAPAATGPTSSDIGGSVVAAIQCAPEGLEFAAPVKLTITSPGRLPADAVAFGMRDDGRRFGLVPATIEGGTAVFELWHFTDYGVGSLTEADLLALIDANLGSVAAVATNAIARDASVAIREIARASASEDDEDYPDRAVIDEALASVVDDFLTWYFGPGGVNDALTLAERSPDQYVGSGPGGGTMKSAALQVLAFDYALMRVDDSGVFSMFGTEFPVSEYLLPNNVSSGLPTEMDPDGVCDTLGALVFAAHQRLAIVFEKVIRAANDRCGQGEGDGGVVRALVDVIRLQDSFQPNRPLWADATWAELWGLKTCGREIDPNLTQIQPSSSAVDPPPPVIQTSGRRDLFVGQRVALRGILYDETGQPRTDPSVIVRWVCTGTAGHLEGDLDSARVTFVADRSGYARVRVWYLAEGQLIGSAVTTFHVTSFVVAMEPAQVVSQDAEGQGVWADFRVDSTSLYGSELTTYLQKNDLEVHWQCGLDMAPGLSPQYDDLGETIVGCVPDPSFIFVLGHAPRTSAAVSVAVTSRSTGEVVAQAAGAVDVVVRNPPTDPMVTTEYNGGTASAVFNGATATIEAHGRENRGWGAINGWLHYRLVPVRPGPFDLSGFDGFRVTIDVKETQTCSYPVARDPILWPEHGNFMLAGADAWVDYYPNWANWVRGWWRLTYTVGYWESWYDVFGVFTPAGESYFSEASPWPGLHRWGDYAQPATDSLEVTLWPGTIGGRLLQMSAEAYNSASASSRLTITARQDTFVWIDQCGYTHEYRLEWY